MRNRIVLALFAGAIALMSLTAPTYAQSTVFTVKFVCGTQHPDSSLVAPSDPPVKPGNYATVINLEALTPTSLEFPATFIATRISSFNSTSGVVVQGPNHSLLQFEVADITCADIVKTVSSFLVPSVPPFITGFVNVLVGATTPIAVSAVYTSQGCFFPPPAITPGRFANVPVCSGPTSVEVVPQHGQSVTFPVPAPQ